MARVKRPVERGPPPAYRSPPANPPENPNPEQNTPVRRTPVRRTPARRTPVRPPAPRRVSRPRAAKGLKKAASTSWFDLDDEGSSPSEIEEAIGDETPIPAIPLRSIKMSDLMETTTTQAESTPAGKTESSATTQTLLETLSGMDSGNFVKENARVVTSSQPINLVEGLCSSDSEDDLPPKKNMEDKEEDGCFLPAYFLPFWKLRMGIYERPRPVLCLPAPPPREGQIEINDDYPGDMANQSSEAGDDHLDPLYSIPDLNENVFEYSDDEYNQDLREHLMS